MDSSDNYEQIPIGILSPVMSNYDRDNFPDITKSRPEVSPLAQDLALVGHIPPSEAGPDKHLTTRSKEPTVVAEDVAILLNDPSPDVRLRALGAANRLGNLTNSELISAFADDEVRVVLRALTLTAARVSDPASSDFVGPLVELVALSNERSDEANTTDLNMKCEAAAFVLGELLEDRSGERVHLTHDDDPESDGMPDVCAAHRRAVQTLCVTARKHADSLCRESAVAALGAIGCPESLPTILDAMSDRAAIRRRAVIALAAFDGDHANETIVAALDDRDWQVRDIAMALTSTSADPDDAPDRTQ